MRLIRSASAIEQSKHEKNTAALATDHAEPRRRLLCAEFTNGIREYHELATEIEKNQKHYLPVTVTDRKHRIMEHITPDYLIASRPPPALAKLVTGQKPMKSRTCLAACASSWLKRGKLVRGSAESKRSERLSPGEQALELILAKDRHEAQSV